MSNASEYRTLYYRDTKTQKEMTLDYMERYGSISPLEALSAYGCMRLAARIADLKKDGYFITKRIADDGNYAIYRLGDEEWEN